MREKEFEKRTSGFQFLSSDLCFLASDIRLRVNVINLRLGVILVGADFQPRLDDYNVKGTSFVAGKPFPQAVDELFKDID